MSEKAYELYGQKKTRKCKRTTIHFGTAINPNIYLKGLLSECNKTAH